MHTTTQPAGPGQGTTAVVRPSRLVRVVMGPMLGIKQVMVLRLAGHPAG
jgi:hypothetical protein